MNIRPEILSAPNIPRPLHGLNPRTIKGKEWWDNTRHKAQKDYGYKCAACGVEKSKAKKHKWLEGHELWDINYYTGRCEIIEIVPLCHYCHNFIHSGRLGAIAGKEKSITEVEDILTHGFKILSDNNLEAFPGTILLADMLDVDTFGVESYEIPKTGLEWSNYYLVLEGVKYKSLYKDYSEWKRIYK